MDILGVSAFGDESAACLLRDGVPLAAASEERFTRTKRDAALPLRAVRFCLRRGGLEPHQLDWVVFYEKPLRRFERVLASQMANFPRSGRSFSRHLFVWLGDRLWLKGRLAAEIGVSPDKVLFVEHQQSHAASAFFASPFDEAAVLCADGAGEWATTALARGRGRELEILAEVHFPHSLGLLASAVTQFLGFAPFAEEHKVAELAAHGAPRFAEPFSRLLRPRPDGSFELDLAPFRFAFDEQLTFGAELERRLGARRVPGAPLQLANGSTRDADVAASLQQALGDALLALARALHAKAPSKNLCLAGSLALNPWLNARLLAEGPFERLFVQPAAHDGGGALGAALYAWHALLGWERSFTQEHAFLGEEAVRAEVDPPISTTIRPRKLATETEWVDAIAALLAAGKLVGLARGRFEFSPRSLGHRTLFADPRAAGARERLDRALKRREPFRPYAPVVAEERAGELFEIPPGGAQPARYKLLAVRVKAEARSAVPALAHADGTACVQVVGPGVDPRLHRLLLRVGELTGSPVLLSAALNPRGDPMARGAHDALAAFERSSVDALAIEDELYER